MEKTKINSPKYIDGNTPAGWYREKVNVMILLMSGRAKWIIDGVTEGSFLKWSYEILRKINKKR